jgi:hypothetical protein
MGLRRREQIPHRAYARFGMTMVRGFHTMSVLGGAGSREFGVRLVRFFDDRDQTLR